jgi:hypothetical protein
MMAFGIAYSQHVLTSSQGRVETDKQKNINHILPDLKLTPV